MKNKKFTLIEIMIVSAIMAFVIIMSSMFWKRITGMFITQRDVIVAVDTARNSLLRISLDIKQAASILKPKVSETTNELVLIKQKYELDKDPKTAKDFDGHFKKNAPICYTEEKITYKLEDYTKPHNPFKLKRLVRIIEYPKGTTKKQELRRDISTLSFIRTTQKSDEFIEPNKAGFPASSIQTVIDVIKYNALRTKTVKEKDPKIDDIKKEIRKYVLTQSLMTKVRGTRL